MAIPLPRPGAVFDLTRSAVNQAAGSAAAFAAVPARAFAVLDDVEALVRRIHAAVDRAEAALDRTERLLDDAAGAIRQVDVISASVAGAIDQVAALTATAETLVADADRVATRAGGVVDDAERITAGAGALVEDAGAITTAAATVVAEADRVSTSAASVVVEAEQVTERAAGTVVRAETTAATADELLAAYAQTLRKGAPMARRFVEELSPDEVTAAIRLVDELPRLTHHLTGDILPILATLDRVGPDIHDLLEVTRDLKLAVAGIPGLRMLRRRGEDRLADEEDASRSGNGR
ncbi:hypothetical protein [Plantactinospora sp. GCM10030261]|uniref:hypothetical protein n=1 Tax=Plantactinospora sp. GCM10030261 TaxID=3273420 RepID=UPI003608A50E